MNDRQRAAGRIVSRIRRFSSAHSRASLHRDEAPFWALIAREGVEGTLDSAVGRQHVTLPRH